MFLGEAPSYQEDEQGRPFVGKTGVEFNELYLPVAGLYRGDVVVYNAVCCSRIDYSNPSPEDAESCSSMFLGPLLKEVNPTILVPMGQVACSLFPKIKLPLQHGIPVVDSWGAWSGVVFPMYHPSAGMRSTGYMIALMSDFDALGKLVKAVL
jgi:DNA polymerase